MVHGDKGNDYLYGGDGNDTYEYRNGDGIDILHDTAGNDRIWCPDLVGVSVPKARHGNDLLIFVGDGGIRVVNHFSTSKIEKIDCGK